MDIEENLAQIFGEEEAEIFRIVNQILQNRRRSSAVSDTSFRGSDLSNPDSLDRSNVSETSSTSEEINEEIVPVTHDEWTDDPSSGRVFIPFSGRPGILLPSAAQMSAIDYFKIFFNVQFLSTLADMTNQHANEVRAKGFKPESRLKRWKDTCADELLKFLGVLFFMGSVRMNKISDYWHKTHLVTFHLTRHMSRNRFLLILRMLYFKFNEHNTNIYDKVDDLIKYFNDTMKTTIYPGKEVTIDESMVLFRGRLKIRQYIKNKRHKFGVKLYVLADPKGLVHRIHMYKGSADNEVGGTGHVKKVVLKLINDYLDSGHALYMDNFYSSVDLAEILLSKKTYCTGTLLTNRKGNPRVVTMKKLSKGTSIYRRNQKGVCVMKWKDKRDVLTISTEHPPEFSQIINKFGRVMSKPIIISKYNQFMKGVDRHDQMLAYYPCEHKCVRWYKKIGIHIFQMMFLNAYFLYKEGTGAKLSLYAFREKVLSSLLPPTSRILPSQHPTHMPQELARNSNGVLKRRKCTRCWGMKKRKDSGIYCPDCDIGLCIACFGPYHVENKLLA